MAKNKITRREVDKQQEAKELLRISKRAKAELAEVTRLLKDEKSENVTRRQLETGLEEVDRDLKKLFIWIHIFP
jgi:ribosomal protein L16/L10AE